jgi:hypothetical protein
MEVGYKAFKAGVFQRITLRSNRFDFEPEITARIARRGFRIYEVPVSYDGRSYAEGKKITWKDGFHALYAIVRYNLWDAEPRSTEKAAVSSSREEVQSARVPQQLQHLSYKQTNFIQQSGIDTER